MNILTDCDLERMYNEFLDEVYGEVKIGAYDYCTSDALKSTDPVAYRCGFGDWLDAEMSDGRIFELPDGTYTDSEPEDETA